VPWGPGRDWSRFDAVLVRDTWDYIFDRNAFLEWAAEVAAVTRLANSVEVLRWNTDKRYLRDLEAAGVPTVPTVWVEPGDDVPAVVWDELVVKPSISAGARLSARYRRGDDIGEHLRRIHATGAAAMLQPYVPAVESEGETGTYVFGGEVRHAVSKGPVLARGRGPSDDLSAASHQLVGPAAVDPVLARFALRVLEAAAPMLYAGTGPAAPSARAGGDRTLPVPRARSGGRRRPVRQRRDRVARLIDQALSSSLTGSSRASEPPAARRRAHRTTSWSSVR
jgi:hypothetical protein